MKWAKVGIPLLIIPVLGAVVYFMIGQRQTTIFVDKITKVKVTDTTLVHSNKSLGELLDSLPINPNTIQILIDKSEYSLAEKSGQQTIKSYPVVFGGNPVDDKRKAGDQCTPEGTFHMVDKYPHRSWNKFIWLNYPTPESWKKHRQAKASGAIPSDASIGGEIGIHGVPSNNDSLIEKRINWTLGCISMRNDHLNEIYPYITKHTAITIRK